jgi:ribonuclease Z
MPRLEGIPRMRRLLMGLLAVLVVAGAAAYALRGPISQRILRAALARIMSQDPLAAFPDGLHVVLCGAGGPMPDPNRSGPCVAVVAGRTLVVVDAGTRGARNLGPLRLPPALVEALFLTHFHSDHIDGLGELALLRWGGGSWTTPLYVFGPSGVEQVVAGFNQAYASDTRYRIAHHGSATMPPGGAGMKARAFEPPTPGTSTQIFERNGLVVRAFLVDHAPVKPAVGYRFDYGGRSVVVSGDTKRSPEVARVAAGVDLLVHEALSARLVAVMNQAAVAAGRDNVATITSDIPSYHTTPVEAAELAQSAGVGHLLYYHVVPPLILPGMDAVFLDGTDAAFPGGITLGTDGTRISLPAGSDAIEVTGS